jgi:hypothetical protein
VSAFNLIARNSIINVKHPNVTFEDLVVDIAIDGEYTIRFKCSKL